MNKNNFKKLKQFVSKYDTYILFAFLLIFLIGPIMIVKLEVSDEVWNFQNVAKICNGFEIYKEANIITTPLFFYIGVLFCKIFGTAFITFRIYNVILITILTLIVYEVFKALKIDKLKSLIYTMLIYIISIILSTAGANYNVLVVIFFVIGLLLSIRKSTFKQKIYDILQGIVIFLIFLTKQNVVIYYTMALILSELLLNENNFKKIIKSILTKISIALTFILMYLIILCFNGGLGNFINYTVLGIPEFSNNFFVELHAIKNMGIIFIIYVVVFMSIYHKNNSIHINDEMKNNIINLSVFGIFMELMAYPIFNLYHSMLGAYIIYILGFYLLDIIFAQYFNKSRKYLVIISLILSIIFFIYSLYNVITYILSNKCEEIQIYKYIILEEDIKKQILNIDKYIKYKEDLGTNVVIFSGNAAIYMLPLNKSNGDMDLPFLGNMGANGEANMLEKLKGLVNTEILIVKDEKNLFSQESKLIRKYIMENYTYKRRDRKI